MKTILFLLAFLCYFGSVQAAVKPSPMALPQTGPFFQIVYILNGAQQVANVTASGGVTSDAIILWDERTQGPVPQGVDPLTASLVGGVLMADATKVAAAQAAAAAAATAAAKDTTDRNAYKAAQALLAAGTATPAQVQAILLFIIRHPGNF